jgi:L-amino acid N-acyltransferase YncA
MMSKLAAPDDIRIREMQPDDWSQVRAIYDAGIATGQATFETEPPTWESWHARHGPDLRFVAVERSAVAGWVAAGRVYPRACYAGVIEHSVYVSPDRWGRGIGRLLLDALTDAADAAGYWTIQAGIFPENRASVALHRACGFRVVGRRERLGRLDGVWRDVLLLERRSAGGAVERGADPRPESGQGTPDV